MPAPPPANTADPAPPPSARGSGARPHVARRWRRTGIPAADSLLDDLAGACRGVGARLAADWPLSDNHIYLLAYWCLGVGLCLRVGDGVDAVARMSRWLVGSVFLCAILWKGLLAPDFTDARFFRVTLIIDDRFAVLARSVGGLSEAQLAANRRALIGLPAGAEIIDGPVLVEPPALRRLGLALTWGGLLLEAGLAWTFLSAWPSTLHRRRHLLLMVFAVVTYAAAPVAGFGWLLAAMGCAQCAPDRVGVRAGYVLVFAVVLVYSRDAARAAAPRGVGILTITLLTPGHIAPVDKTRWMRGPTLQNALLVPSSIVTDAADLDVEVFLGRVDPGYGISEGITVFVGDSRLSPVG